MKLDKKIKGNTIIEVLIALTILSFCATLAVVIYLNIQKSNLTFFKIKAVELAEQYMRDTFNKKTFTDETYKAEEFTVKRKITVNLLYPDCFTVRIIVFDGSQKKIHELEGVVFGGNQ